MHLKNVKINDVPLTGEKAKSLTQEELYSISQIIEQLEDGERQIAEYGRQLEKRFGNLRLHKFVVAALGFERVCFRKIES